MGTGETVWREARPGWRQARPCGGVVTVFIGPKPNGARGFPALADSDDPAPIDSDPAPIDSEARPCGPTVGAGETGVEASKTMWRCCDSFHLAQSLRKGGGKWQVLRTCRWSLDRELSGRRLQGREGALIE